MNPGGEPERDDTGLPPVDIEIPDDARELDRDMQAYFRELRAERRRQRRRRLHGGLTRDGVILPLLACCLILALITGTLLTVFTATSDQNLGTLPPGGANPNQSAPPPTTSPSASSSASASAPAGTTQPGVTAGPALTPTTVHLSDSRLKFNDQAIARLRGLTNFLLVLIPPDCRCTATVSRLASIGARTGGTVLVGTQATIAEAERLQSRLNPSVSTTIVAGLDSHSVLQNAVQAVGLTAVVITGQPTASGAQSAVYARGLTSSDLRSSNSPLSEALVQALQG